MSFDLKMRGYDPEQVDKRIEELTGQNSQLGNQVKTLTEELDSATKTIDATNTRANNLQQKLAELTDNYQKLYHTATARKQADDMKSEATGRADREQQRLEGYRASINAIREQVEEIGRIIDSGATTTRASRPAPMPQDAPNLDMGDATIAMKPTKTTDAEDGNPAASRP